MDFYSFSPYVRHVRMKEIFNMTPAYVDPDYVFTYVQGGSAVFLLEDRKYTVNPGDVVFMPPYMRHIITPHRSLDQRVLHFDLFYKPERKEKIEAEKSLNYSKFCGKEFHPENILCSCPNVVSLHIEDRKKIEQKFSNLRKHFTSGQPGAELLVKAIMLEILFLFLQKSGQKTLADKHPKAWRNVSKAINHIHDNYMRPLDLKEISEHAGLTLNYFCNIFRECTGTTPHHYINAVRLREAKQLMEDSNMNFTEISEQTGFSSIHAFSKIFKKFEGASPSEYMSELRNNELNK